MDNFFNIKIISKKKKINNDTNNSLIVKNRYDLINLDSFVINRNLALKLLNLSRRPMNIFITGKKGVGKYTLSRFYIYNILNIESDLQELIYTYDNKELTYYYSKYHYEIIITKYNFNDIQMIVNFFKSICKENNSLSQVHNVIVVKNIHIIKKNNLKYLKNILEKYSNNNIFIFISHNIIPDNLKGFLSLIRVPIPKYEDLNKLCNSICKKENYGIKKDEVEHIIKLSENSLSKLINIIELSFIDGSYEKYDDVDITKYKFIVKILKKKKMDTLFILRDLINELIIDNIDYNVILTNILNLFIIENKKNKVDDLQINKIIEYISKCDVNISNGLREIHHLEYLFVQIMNIL